MRFLALIGALAIIVGIGAAVFFLGGFYSVAGTAEDPGIVRWALIQTRTASINRHATDQPPANINDAQTVQAGAKAFAAHGCANCHGAPGVPWLKYSEGLHPDPPDLKEVVDTVCWRPAFIDGETSESAPRLFQAARPFFRLLSPLRILYVSGKDLGRAMVQAAAENVRGRTIENPEIRMIADKTADKTG